MEAVLEVREAVKRFGATTALDGATIALAPGEWLALLGPNGAGKTTLVRAVTGRVRLERGTITLFGEVLTRDTAGQARDRLGLVPQEIALYPVLTARENLRFFGRLRRLAGAVLDERVRWALDWSGLVERADEPIERFSGGMKRRLNLVTSVLHRPAVLLLDEPTVGVDPQSRERIWEMLGELRRSGTSLLLTTHQLDEAQEVADRIVIVDHGRTIATGTFEELVARTIGSDRRVVLSLGDPVPAALGGDVAAGDGTLARPMQDVAVELPALLARVREAGGDVRDIRIEAPTLQAVFLHLTGRELRE